MEGAHKHRLLILHRVSHTDMKSPVDTSVHNKINQGYVSLSAAEPLQ